MGKLTKKERRRLRKLQKQKEQHVGFKLKSPPGIKTILRKNLFFMGILVLLSVGLYYNSLDNEVTLVDDMQSFVFDERTTDLQESLRFGQIQKIVYAISYRYWEYDPLPLRVVSVTLHTTVTLLVFLFVYKIYGRKIAMMSALIFAVHPINTEAATWISGSPYLYVALFTYIILLLYLSYKHSQKKRYLYFSLAVYVLMIYLVRAPWILVVPMTMVVLDQFILEDKFDLSKLWWVALYAIPISIYLFTYFGEAYENRVATRSEGGKRVTLNTQALKPVVEGYPYTTFLMSRLYVFPHNLTVYYDGMEVTKLLYFSMYTIFIVYAIVLIYLWKRNRELAGLFIIMPIMLGPTYSPVKITWFLAERYLYSGTAIFAILVSIALLYLGRVTKIKYLPYLILAPILVVFSILTYIRNDEWQNTVTLSFANMRASPLSVRPYNDIGGHYYYQGDVNKAVEYYEQALTVVETSGTAINNLGFIYLEHKPLIFWDEFKPEEVDENYAKIMLDNGINYLQQQEEPRTVSYFLNKALAYNPNSIDTAIITADLYYNLGLAEHAKNLYLHALSLDPENEHVIKQLILLNN